MGEWGGQLRGLHRRAKGGGKRGAEGRENGWEGMRYGRRE